MYINTHEINEQLLSEGLKKLIGELKYLNSIYGDSIQILNRNRLFHCPECGYEVVYNPHKKIEEGAFKISSISFESRENPTNVTAIYVILLSVRCRNPGEKLIPTEITLDHTLRILREERDFVEHGKKRGYEYYTV